MTLFSFCILFFFAGCGKKVGDNADPSGDDTNHPPREEERYIVTNGKGPILYLINAENNDIVWQWDATQSNIETADKKWFTRGPDEVKPVYDLKYILITVSVGGVALVRIADKKVVWYAHAGSSPHSAELLPDGNIVVACAESDELTVLHVDTTQVPNTGYRSMVDVPNAHNVVWDRKRKVLWTASQNRLFSFTYNFDCEKPQLAPKDTFMLPGNSAHDLFPVYGQDSLYFTNTTGFYFIDLATANPSEKTISITRVNTSYQKNVKCASSGPSPAWPTLIQYPTNKHYSDKLIDLAGNTIISFPGWTIYKARWFVPNLFSYPEENPIRSCN